MNRRDFIKWGGIAALAAVQPWDAYKLLGVSSNTGILQRLTDWGLSAHAAGPAGLTSAYIPGSKTIWNAMLHSSSVDLSVTHRMPFLQQYQRTSIATTGWAVSTNEPDSQWLDNFAVYVNSTHTPSYDRKNWFFFDHED